MLRGATRVFMNTEQIAAMRRSALRITGETHDDLGFFSYDRAAKRFMLRQFHIEGFVCDYVIESMAKDGRIFVFVSAPIENFMPGWRGRETYRFLNDDKFIETFARRPGQGIRDLFGDALSAEIRRLYFLRGPSRRKPAPRKPKPPAGFLPAGDPFSHEPRPLRALRRLLHASRQQ